MKLTVTLHPGMLNGRHTRRSAGSVSMGINGMHQFLVVPTGTAARIVRAERQLRELMISQHCVRTLRNNGIMKPTTILRPRMLRVRQARRLAGSVNVAIDGMRGLIVGHMVTVVHIVQAKKHLEALMTSQHATQSLLLNGVMRPMATLNQKCPKVRQTL